jgi:hypothetical protein
VNNLWKFCGGAARDWIFNAALPCIRSESVQQSLLVLREGPEFDMGPRRATARSTPINK